MRAVRGDLPDGIFHGSGACGRRAHGYRAAACRVPVSQGRAGLSDRCDFDGRLVSVCRGGAGLAASGAVRQLVASGEIYDAICHTPVGAALVAARGRRRATPLQWTYAAIEILPSVAAFVVMRPMSKLRIGVLGSGSGSNMQSIVDAIAAGRLNAALACVISDVPGARILERARQHNVPGLYLDPAPFKTKLDGVAEQQYIETLRRYGVDTVVLAGFMRMVKPGVLRAFPGRVLNIHPALLPAFPGVHAWEQALTHGAKVAGCTVHVVDEGMDSGPIIVQRAVPVLPEDTAATLHARIQEQEHQAYPEALQLLAEERLRIEGRRVMILPRT